MPHSPLTGTRKNLYIRGKTIPLLEHFEDEGGNSSELFADALRRWDRKRRAAQRAGAFTLVNGRILRALKRHRA